MDKIVLEQIKLNQERMEFLAKHFGDKYYRLFGEKVRGTNDIQRSINECWEYFNSEEYIKSIGLM